MIIPYTLVTFCRDFFSKKYSSPVSQILTPNKFRNLPSALPREPKTKSCENVKIPFFRFFQRKKIKLFVSTFCIKTLRNLKINLFHQIITIFPTELLFR